MRWFPIVVLISGMLGVAMAHSACDSRPVRPLDDEEQEEDAGRESGSSVPVIDAGAVSDAPDAD